MILLHYICEFLRDYLKGCCNVSWKSTRVTKYQSCFQSLFQAMQWKWCPWEVSWSPETTRRWKVLSCCHWDRSLHFEQKLLPLWLQCDRYLCFSDSLSLLPFMLQDGFFSFLFLSRESYGGCTENWFRQFDPDKTLLEALQLEWSMHTVTPGNVFLL